MIIDTNVYSALDAGKTSAKDIIKRQTSIQLPIIVVGELRYGFTYGAREAENTQRLDLFLAQDSVELLLVNNQTAHVYAELASWCRKRGRALSNNDLWIAALAKQHDVALATYDKDFLVFEDILGQKLFVLED